MKPLIGPEALKSTDEILDGTQRRLPLIHEDPGELIAPVVEENLHIHRTDREKKRLIEAFNSGTDFVLGTLVVAGLAAAIAFNYARDGVAHNPIIHPPAATQPHK